MSDTQVTNPENNEVKKSPAKKTLRKKILSVLLVILVVIVALLAIVLWQIDRVAATATRTVGSALTGTKVDVQSINIRPLLGLVKVKNFSVGNPEGFHKPEAIKVGTFHVDAGMKSLLSDKIEVEYLELSGVAIDFEYTFSKGSNLDVILKNVEKATGADKKKAAAKEEKSDEKAEKSEKPAAQKQVVIRKLVLKDTKVTVSSGALKTSMVIPLVPIEMENVGEGTDLGGAISEVLVRIIAEIGKVVNFDQLGKSFSAAGDGILKGADQAGKSLMSAGESAGKALDDTVNKSLKMIKSLPGLGK